MLDLVLRGGTVCDGSGGPAFTADVAIAGGRVAAIGRVSEAARHAVDVAGLIVAPGFVDVHTHYDAQVSWDRMLTPSCWHGVTSVVIGNCGFALAPCRPAERDRLLRMLENVEGMPLASLRAGVDWTWHSIPDYLAMLRARPLGLNVGALIGHSSLRAYVLGDDAYERAATADEIARMATLVRDAMDAGTLGLATSLSPGHVGAGGRPVPSRQATRDELRALAGAMAAGGRGVLEITPATFPLADDECDFLQSIARETGRAVSFSAILDLPDRDGVWPPLFARLRAGQATGALVAPQVSCRPMRFDFDLETGCASLDAVPDWRRFREAGDRAARLALLADDGFRAVVRAATIGRASSPSSRRWAEVVLEETPAAADRPLAGRTLGEIATLRGGDAIDALFDLARADLGARFSMLLLNYDDARVAALLREPESLVALSDAGAHVSVLCDAGYATHLLGYWARERALFAWPEAVRRLTSMPADLYGLAGRGRLVPGAAADVTCFDPTTVGSRTPEKVADFPAGASRWIVRADGIALVVIGGTVFLEHGELTGAQPGRLLGVADQRSSNAS